MRYFFYSILIVYFLIVVLKNEHQVRKDMYCKEGLFFQMVFKQCTPRKFNYDNSKQQNI